MTDTLKTWSALLSTTLAAVATPGVGETVMVSSFRMVNISTSTITVNAAVELNIIPEDMALTAGYAYVDSDPITLSTGKNFYAMASSNASVHCTVSGIMHTT